MAKPVSLEVVLLIGISSLECLRHIGELVLFSLLTLLHCSSGEEIPPLPLKDGVFRCLGQLYDCLLTEVHERSKKGIGLAKRLNGSLGFFCHDLLSVIDPRQVFELVNINKIA